MATVVDAGLLSAGAPKEKQGMWIIGGGQPALQFDAVIREGHSAKNTITENPVDGDSPFHDHAIVMPYELEIEACVGDITLHDAPTVFDSDASRSVTAWEKLNNLKDSKQPFTVITGLRRCTNMMIEDLNASQDASSAEALIFTARLKQIRIANTKVVDVPPRKAGKTKRQAPKKTDGGEKKAEPPKPVDRASLLTKLGNYLTGGSDVSLQSVLP